VKQSGGYITVDTAVDRGTTFCVYLPRVDEQEESESMLPLSVLHPACSGTVLIVEDELAVRGLVEVILTAHSYKVLTTDSASDAIAICRESAERIDLLLTDVVMPGISGPELAKELVSLRPGLKVIYMSGYAGEHLAEQGVTSEGVTLLQKPFTSSALQEKVRQVLNEPVMS